MSAFAIYINDIYANIYFYYGIDIFFDEYITQHLQHWHFPQSDGFLQRISDLVQSIYEAIGGILHLAYSLFHGILSFIAGIFAAAFSFVSDTVHGLVSIYGGLGKFVAGNFIVIGVLAAAGYFYIQQQQQQRKAIKASSANKKTIKTI